MTSAVKMVLNFNTNNSFSEQMTEAETTAMIRRKPRYQRRPDFMEKGPMLNSTFNILYKFYKPFNEKMAAITEDKRFLYEHELKPEE